MDQIVEAQLTVKPVGVFIGAEVTGVDLSRPLGD